MAQQNSSKGWADGVANLAVDAMLDAQILKKEDLSRAKEIISEEIFARLSVKDYPPPIPVK